MSVVVDVVAPAADVAVAVAAVLAAFVAVVLALVVDDLKTHPGKPS